MVKTVTSKHSTMVNEDIFCCLAYHVLLVSPVHSKASLDENLSGCAVFLLLKCYFN